MVLTSHDQLGKTGFRLEEFAASYYVFKDVGAMVTLASLAGAQPPVDPKSEEPQEHTSATKRVSALLEKGRLVTGFSNSEEEAAGLVPFLVESSLIESGGNYSKTRNREPYVVADRYLITGQNPSSSEPAACALLSIRSGLDEFGASALRERRCPQGFVDQKWLRRPEFVHPGGWCAVARGAVRIMEHGHAERSIWLYRLRSVGNWSGNLVHRRERPPNRRCCTASRA
jgi:putative intracellular protease/amidase